MVAARSGRMISVNYDDIISSIDWNRVLIQAEGLHRYLHPGNMKELCGSCIQSVLLRQTD